jgi:drug/metabolite transporter (DMT)-like permease
MRLRGRGGASVSLAALLLVCVAAVLHTGWNLVVKRATDKHLFTCWALLIGTLLYLPLLPWGWPIPAGIWPYAMVSALMEMVYFMALIYAYERGDFSLVYPISRGAAPAFLAMWGALFLGESPHPVGIAGLVVLLMGLLVVGGGSWWVQRRTASLSTGSVGAAVGVALCISIYSAIDGFAVRLMAPAVYAELVFGLTAALLTPAVLGRYGYQAAIDVWRRQWQAIIGVGLVMLPTYMLVLQAYALARVSYVGALREVSIVLAALVGWLWLKEGFGAVRTIGSILIVAGMLVIALVQE